MMTAPSPGHRSRHLRVSRPMRVVAYLFSFLVVLYLATVAVLSTSWFNRIILEHTRAALEQVTGARVEIGELIVEPWTFQVTLRSLVLHGSEAPPELPLFAARALVIQISPTAAFHRRLRLRRVDLEGAQVHLYTRPDGSTNLPGPATQGEGLAGLDNLVDLGIRQLVVAQSSATWNNRQWPLDLSARDVSVVLGFRAAVYSGSLSANAVNLSNPSVALPPVTFATRVELARNRLGLDSLVWRSTAMKGSGTLILHWQPALETQFT
ncbi:MAG TPA: hypothetical protein VL523_07465, partial [Terriglobia bacterium]|nr:hypothetical protein [Terriglobia bacterium]